ncbi:MAG: hypothetical protein BGO21_26140 [Dyadobacter sp. 50-39]|nr:MAG: hypothetical protein BGO21_26140 [Dyadobacter sp. 50-39]
MPANLPKTSKKILVLLWRPVEGRTILIKSDRKNFLCFIHPETYYRESDDKFTGTDSIAYTLPTPQLLKTLRKAFKN